MLYGLVIPMVRSVIRLFSADKSISSSLLNRCGAQVFRTVMARAVYRMRPVLGKGTPGGADWQARIGDLLGDGLVIWPDFLSADAFGEVHREAMSLEAAACQFPDDLPQNALHHGPNRLQLVVLSDKCWHRFPAIRDFYEDPRLVGLMQAGERRPLGLSTGHRAFEHLVQGPESELTDPETHLHSDIFFHTHKAWLYLEDVGLEHGPLVAVKRSHLLSASQLGYVYAESCGTNQGSRRITLEEMRRLGFEETVLAVPKNTLVIANTCGYHRRLRGQPGKERFAIHWSLRANPFRMF